MRTTSKFLITGVLVACSAAVQAAPVNITGSSIRTEARQGTATYDFVDDTATTFGSRTSVATAGGSSARVDLTWTDLGTAAIFDFDFDQTRDGSVHSYARTYESTLRFTATTDTTYSFSGLYFADDNGNAGRLYNDVFLTDLTAGQTLFRDLSDSRNTVDESFVLGDAGDADTNNLNQGTISGNLIAGRQYQLFFQNLNHSWPDADQGGTATGCLTFAVGTTANSNCGTSVPAPAPLALFGIGLLLLGFRRNKNTAA